MHHHRRVFIAAFTCSVCALAFSLNASSRPAISDADWKDILAILFQREIHAQPDASETVVLLGPNINPAWIPTVAGLRFQRLGYEEVRQVREYYELTSFEAHGRDVEVGLAKGNYCKKAGPFYRFRKEKGEWRAEAIGSFEYFSGVGMQCAGCATGSGAVYTVKPTVRAPHEASTPEREPGQRSLVLNGKALAVHCRRKDARRVDCSVDLNLQFSNKGVEPVIILQPDEDYQFWHGATSLASSKADSESHVYLYHHHAWPSIYPFPEYRELGERLDRPAPPPKVTRVIRPLENWIWKTSVNFGVEEENNCNDPIGVEIGWKEIKRLSSPLWLRVSYEMWPFNVENFKRNLGGKLRKRWKQYGALYLEEKSGGYWFASITSEPIELDFRQVEPE